MFALGCSSLFGIDESERRVPSSAGNPSVGGSDSGASGGATGEGAADNAAGAAGNAAASGNVTSGASGNAPVSRPAGGGSGGSGNPVVPGGGAIGSGGLDAGPTLSQPCADDAALACAAVNHQLVLRCDEGAWAIDEICDSGHRCDRDAAGCRQLSPICRDHGGSVCFTGGQLAACDADLFEHRNLLCAFGCSEGACLPGSGAQLSVHPETHWESTPWPSDIPVCFAWGSADDEMRRWIREELESTWGRYLDVEFVGFESCEDGATGVVLELLEDCRDRLGSGVTLGYPGDGKASHVGFCRTYRNAQGLPRTLYEPLTRFLTRHQFGHVLGLPEDDYHGGVASVMMRGIDYVSADRLPALTYAPIRSLSGRARKPSRSLVTTRGRCLATVDGKLRAVRCTGRPEQRWTPGLDHLVSSSDATEPLCVARSSALDSEVEMKPCVSDPPLPPFRMPHAQWTVPGRCVAPVGGRAMAGNTLQTERCGPMGAAPQAWFFEILSSDAESHVARIRLSDSSLCVTAYDENIVPMLAPCGAGREQLFRLKASGDIELGGRCVNWEEPDSTLYLGTCGFDRWLVSGAIETSEGVTLYASPEDGSVRVNLLVEPPALEQTFDFYF